MAAKKSAKKKSTTVRGQKNKASGTRAQQTSTADYQYSNSVTIMVITLTLLSLVFFWMSYYTYM